MDTDKLLQFWPSPNQTRQERTESSVRFIIYATLLAFLLKRDTRIVLLGVLVLASIYLYTRLVPVSPMNSSSVTYDNPVGNQLLTDDPNKPPTRATNQEISQKLNLPSRWAERQFYTIPQDDLKSYLEFNGRGFPSCRDNQWACNADTNPRHPEWVQMRGTFGPGNPKGGGQP